LHTVLDCPAKTCLGAGVQTVVLFFTKGEKTSKTWYYQLDPGRSLGKTNALNDADLEDFIKLQASFADSAKSWTVDTTKLNANFDLSVNNPNAEKQQPLREPATIIDTITNLDNQSAALVAKIRGLL
jgi:type I restriction enzyme M protein